MRKKSLYHAHSISLEYVSKGGGQKRVEMGWERLTFYVSWKSGTGSLVISVSEWPKNCQNSNLDFADFRGNCSLAANEPQKQPRKCNLFPPEILQKLIKIAHSRKVGRKPVLKTLTEMKRWREHFSFLPKSGPGQPKDCRQSTFARPHVLRLFRLRSPLKKLKKQSQSTHLQKYFGDSIRLLDMINLRYSCIPRTQTQQWRGDGGDSSISLLTSGWKSPLIIIDFSSPDIFTSKNQRAIGDPVYLKSTKKTPIGRGGAPKRRAEEALPTLTFQTLTWLCCSPHRLTYRGAESLPTTSR